MRYFEDFRVGEVVTLGRKRVSREEIVAFAREYDPQPFHLDDEAGARSPYGGLIASGWHTAAMFMGLFVREILLGSASLGSPGVEELRWLRPVRPGDELTGVVRVVDVRASERNPSRGTVTTESEVLNQDGEVVMRMRARGFFARRPPGA
jgi:acyl dehydratase